MSTPSPAPEGVSVLDNNSLMPMRKDGEEEEEGTAQGWTESFSERCATSGGAFGGRRVLLPDPAYTLVKIQKQRIPID